MRARKSIVFSQFADTVNYLVAQLMARGVERVAAATGETDDPTKLAWRFSPQTIANGKTRFLPGNELDVLVATDVLSEGQKPARRIDRSSTSICLGAINPAHSTSRPHRPHRPEKPTRSVAIRSCRPTASSRSFGSHVGCGSGCTRNAEVVGTDEAFSKTTKTTASSAICLPKKPGFSMATPTLIRSRLVRVPDLEKCRRHRPDLQKTIHDLPNVVYLERSTSQQAARAPEGVLVYVRTGRGNRCPGLDRRIRDDTITESQYAILKAAECDPQTPRDARKLDRHPRFGRIRPNWN